MSQRTPDMDPSQAVERILEIMPEMMRLVTRGMELDPAEFDLTLGQFKALITMPADGSISMSVLAHSLGISMPAATDVVDRLVRDGLLRREADPKDRRVVRISLTPLGTRSRSQCHDARRRRWLELLSLLTPAQCTAMVRHLSTFNELLHQASVLAEQAPAHSKRGR